MNFEKSPTPRACKIERLEGVGGNEVSFSPERGGIITSIKFEGTEVLYLEDATFRDTAKNVRGGIPLLFPQAGPADETRFPGLKQHGLARLSSEWKLNPAPNKNLGSFSESLTVLEPTASFPYKFRTDVTGMFDEAGAFVLTQSGTNLEEVREMPISMGLHPYFKVPHGERKNIIFDFPGGEVAAQKSQVWMSDGTVVLDNPGTPLRVYIPELGTLILSPSSEYRNIWIWSKPDADFICIEPVMRNEGGIVNDPHMLRPGESLAASLSVQLER
jgi:galactose mutarotase-like enzyme